MLPPPPAPPQINLLACRFMDAQGFGRTSDAVQCLDWCRAQGARVVSASWTSGSLGNRPLEEAVARTHQAGMLLVVSSGNQGLNMAGLSLYPQVRGPARAGRQGRAGQQRGGGGTASERAVLPLQASYSSAQALPPAPAAGAERPTPPPPPALLLPQAYARTYPNLLVVGATDEYDDHLQFSNWDRRAVHLHAPGNM